MVLVLLVLLLLVLVLLVLLLLAGSDVIEIHFLQAMPQETVTPSLRSLMSMTRFLAGV